ncbi:UDP-N-acetylmuramoyl-L-alanyl-D-glutamate--2,6-diaminopimelate ligase [Jeotgalibaca sp. A122]|uniref:UDP-N-acetylmuramoyl-L-alanyl-D-glutamate--2, 6-diaminopimelate ligase n=1 Tax=Jeotgalibaca sp. A122 TaxID=3457322 RepID=UPI003FD311A3
MNLEQLFNHIKFKHVIGTFPETQINKITQDTREVEEGDVFICIEGANFDAHDYVDRAIEKGAIAIVARKPIISNIPVIYVSDTTKAMAMLANAFYGYPSDQLKMIGITGTNGKTTTTYIIEAILKGLQLGSGVIGTVGIKINDTFIPTINTTPDSITLQRVFQEMNEKNVAVCAMEVSSQALVKGRVWGVDYDVAVMTNLTHEHMELHQNMEAYRAAKKLLFAQLGNSYKTNKVAVLNKDDHTYAEYREATVGEVLSYSVLDSNSDFYASNIVYQESHTTFDLIYQNESYSVHSNLVGQYNVSNVLAGMAAVFALGYSLTEIVATIPSLLVVSGRMELVAKEEDISLYVDYAHSPDAMEKVLETVKNIAKGRVISVFGCAGKREFEKRPIMTNIGIELSDFSFLTADETMGENQAEIWEMMKPGIPEGATNFAYYENRVEAIYKAVEMAEPGDIILMMGRGNDTRYYDTDGRVYHFTDKEASINGLKRRAQLQK